MFRIFATARLAQSAERKALNLVVVGSSPTVGVLSISFACRRNEPGFEPKAFRCLTSPLPLYVRIDTHRKPQTTFPRKQLCALMLESCLPEPSPPHPPLTRPPPPKRPLGFALRSSATAVLQTPLQTPRRRAYDVTVFDSQHVRYSLARATRVRDPSADSTARGMPLVISRAH